MHVFLSLQSASLSTTLKTQLSHLAPTNLKVVGTRVVRHPGQPWPDEAQPVDDLSLPAALPVNVVPVVVNEVARPRVAVLVEEDVVERVVEVLNLT